MTGTRKRRVVWDWRRRRWLEFLTRSAWYWYKYEPRDGSPGQWVAEPY